jgi:4-hydroxymandelate oxidase
VVGDDADQGPPLPETLAGLAVAARARLPHDIWDFAAGGSGAELTLAANRAAFDEVGLVPRVLTGGGVDPSARLVRDAAAMPVAVAPMAYQRLYHPDGELAMAEAARRASVPFVISTVSSRTIEEIAKVEAVCWFQLYWLRDRSAVLELVQRAEAAGCTALMVTVDVPVMANRRRDLRNRFTLPDHIRPANLGAGLGMTSVKVHTDLVFDAAVSWADLEWLREHTSLPLVLKGVLDPRDACLAADLGVAAVVVSNHGGRQLDGAAPSAAVLPAVVDAVADRLDVLVDSGVRGGTDVLRALALGAAGVLVGRPLLWGLAVAGVAGVTHTLELFREELVEALRLAGCADVRSARELRTVSVRSGGHG